MGVHKTGVHKTRGVLTVALNHTSLIRRATHIFLHIHWTKSSRTFELRLPITLCNNLGDRVRFVESSFFISLEDGVNVLLFASPSL